MFGFKAMISKSFFAAVKAPLFAVLGVFAVLLLLAVACTVYELRGSGNRKEKKE